MSSGLLRKYIDLFEQDKPFKVDVEGLPPPYIVFIGDSIAYGLSSEMMTNSLRDSAVGLTSSAISNRVARNKDVQRAKWAVVSAGTNDFATGQGNAGALESNLDSIRSALKAQKYVWLGPYNEQANAVIKKFAASKSDTFIDLRTFPADSLGIHPRSYSLLMYEIRRETKLGPNDPEWPRLGVPPGLPGAATSSQPAAPSANNNTPVNNTPSAEIEKTQPPGNIILYKNAVKKVQQDFKLKFDRDLPITSQERNRAEQQDLYDRWRRGEKGIYTPLNPANHPGREIFHNTAIDVSPALSREEETWMNQQGWVRTMPTQDPVHYEYQGKWDEPAPSATKPAATEPSTNKDATVTTPKITRQEIDKANAILKKKVKESSELINQLTPQEQMQFWQSVLEADAPVRQEPTFNPDAFDPSAELADKYKQALNTPAASEPKIKIVKDGAGGVAIVAPNGLRIPGFANSKEAMDWMKKDPANYRMAMGNAPNNWIGGTPDAEPESGADPKSKVRVFGKKSAPQSPVTVEPPAPRDLNLRPLGKFDKFKKAATSPRNLKSMAKGSLAGTALASLGLAGGYAFNALRSPDLGDYSPEDQKYIDSIMPALTHYYNNPDDITAQLNPTERTDLIKLINQLRGMSTMKAKFPPNTKWDIYVKTQ